RGSRVTVTVGTGPRMVRVPSNLVGQDIENVRSTLDAMGFDEEVENVDSTEPDGQVLSVSDEGSEIPADSTGTVRVSNGQLIVAPGLVRQTPDDAEEALRDAGWSGRFKLVAQWGPVQQSIVISSPGHQSAKVIPLVAPRMLRSACGRLILGC